MTVETANIFYIADADFDGLGKIVLTPDPINIPKMQEEASNLEFWILLQSHWPVTSSHLKLNFE